MKTVYWFLLSAILTGLAFWFVVSPWYPRNPIAVFLITAFFGAPSIGGALDVIYGHSFRKASIGNHTSGVKKITPSRHRGQSPLCSSIV